MMGKKRTRITVNEDFFDDSIWMSYRYCIGRHTIAAAHRAFDIARYSKYIPEGRKVFLASDIRSTLNDTLRFAPNIEIQGHGTNQDAYSILYSYLQDKEIDFNKSFVEIDLNSETIFVEEGKEYSYIHNPVDDYIDVIGWIELANLLHNDFYKVTVDFNGSIQEYTCIKSFNNRLEDKYVDVDRFKKGIYAGYLCNNYIIKIEKI